jgi:hypothetical protein
METTKGKDADAAPARPRNLGRVFSALALAADERLGFRPTFLIVCLVAIAQYPSVSIIGYRRSFVQHFIMQKFMYLYAPAKVGSCPCNKRIDKWQVPTADRDVIEMLPGALRGGSSSNCVANL